MPKVTVHFFDTTLRDGAQSLPASHQFPSGSKTNIADTIARLGVGAIEAGFPATPADAAEVKAVAQSVGRAKFTTINWATNMSGSEVQFTPVIAGLSRAVSADIEATWQAVRAAKYPRIHTFVSTSDFHRQNKFPGVSRDELVAIATDAVSYAKQVSAAHPGASIEFSAEAASTTEPEYLKRVIEAAVRAGSDIINVPDTVGERDPIWMLDFYGDVISWVTSADDQVTISAHNHNDLGNAAANSFMLVRAASEYVKRSGKDISVQVEATVCGLGERAGNADVFTVASNLFKFAGDLDVEIEWQFSPESSVATAKSVMGAAGLAVDRQAPIVGRDTNVHRSGIHSDGVIKGGHSMYTPFDPMFWGHQEQAVHEDGKYQGKAGRLAAVVR
jgi:2-isopropylmalate synthase